MVPSNPLIKKIVEINSSGRIALCGYFLTAYESPKSFYSFVKSLHYIDILEFGIPSENPFLDGPEISKAHCHVTRSLGINAETALPLLGGLRDIPQPRFVMTYTKEGRELEGFIKLCLLNGIHGILAPDISLAEAQRVSLIATSLHLSYIGFLHEHLDETTVRKTLDMCDIVYLKISPGTTGQKSNLDPVFIDKLDKNIIALRRYKNDLVITVGIGIQTAEQIKTLSALDINMVVLGTSLMQKMQTGFESLQSFTRELQEATAQTKTTRQRSQTADAVFIESNRRN